MTKSSREVLLSACAASACALLFLTYAEYVAPEFIAAGTTRVAVSVAVLLVLGFLAGFCVDGNLGMKLAFLVVVPSAHWLYAGDDSAKPFLTYLIAGIEIVCLWLGATIGHYIRHRNPSIFSSGV
jgi:hypothetical protein